MIAWSWVFDDFLDKPGEISVVIAEENIPKGRFGTISLTAEQVHRLYRELVAWETAGTFLMGRSIPNSPPAFKPGDKVRARPGASRHNRPDEGVQGVVSRCVLTPEGESLLVLREYPYVWYASDFVLVEKVPEPKAVEFRPGDKVARKTKRRWESDGGVQRAYEVLAVGEPVPEASGRRLLSLKGVLTLEYPSSFELVERAAPPPKAAPSGVTRFVPEMRCPVCGKRKIGMVDCMVRGRILWCHACGWSQRTDYRSHWWANRERWASWSESAYYEEHPEEVQPT